jgi:hypothetical protein
MQNSAFLTVKANGSYIITVMMRWVKNIWIQWETVGVDNTALFLTHAARKESKAEVHLLQSAEASANNKNQAFLLKNTCYSCV